jgi:hypothetical protein
MWKSPCTLFPSKLPKILQASGAPLSLGVLLNFLFFAFPNCSCTSHSSSHPGLTPSSLPSSCIPFSIFLPVHCDQFVGSLRRRSPASVRSPAASCMLTRRSEQRMATIMSRFICMSCDTPFSTEKDCVVVPAYHLVISDQARYMHVRMRVTVHPEELRP